MRSFVFLFLFYYFLTSSCPAKCDFFNPLSAILSFIWGPSNNLQYQELPTGAIADDLDKDYLHDPLVMLVLNFNDKLMTAGIVNPQLLGQIIRDEVFLDLMFICPKTSDEKQIAAKNNNKDKANQPTLVIAKTFTSLLDELEKQRNQVTAKETLVEDASDNDKMLVDSGPIPDPDSTQSHPLKERETRKSSITQLSELQNVANSMSHDKMEVDSDSIPNPITAHLVNENKENKSPNVQRLKPQVASNHDKIATDSSLLQKSINAHPANNVEENKSLVEQSESQKDKMDVDSDPGLNPIKANPTQSEPQKDAPSHDKTDTDSGSNKKEIKASPAQQSESQKDDSSVKLIQIKHVLTPENEIYWLEAVNEAKKIKCRAPILGPTKFFEYTEKKLPFKYFVSGFQIYMENYENLIDDNYGFSSTTNKFFWTLTTVFDAPKMRVFCVFQGSHYNKDLYSPEINESFDNHDLYKDEMFPKVDIASLYEEVNQKKVFNTLFKDAERNYFDPLRNKKLVKVHLAPLHSFITPMVRQSAKIYGNVSAMWSIIRNGAWRKVEDYVNIVSHALLDLVVITGTYETLTLDNKEIYLADDKLPVPLVFWKLVLSAPGTSQCAGMFIVTFNNPYEKVDNMLCETDESETHGWEYIQEKDYTKGRTISCAYTEKISKLLNVVSGFDPNETAILTIDRVSKSIHKTWQFDESGQPTTFGQRIDIAKKLRPSASDDSMKKKMVELGETVTPVEKLRTKKEQ